MAFAIAELAPLVVSPIFTAKNFKTSISSAFSDTDAEFEIVLSAISALTALLITFTTVPSPTPKPLVDDENCAAPAMFEFLICEYAAAFISPAASIVELLIEAVIVFVITSTPIAPSKV